MFWCYEVRGFNYYWVIDFYDRLNFLVIFVVIEVFCKEVEDWVKEIKRGKID